MNIIKEYLKEKNNRRTISYEELLKLYSSLDYEALAKKVEALVEDRSLKILNKRNTNGRNPLMYMKYSILEEKDTFEEEIKEIKALNARLNISYYINKPEEYRKHREIINRLNSYMSSSMDRLNRSMAINERSFEIWGKEKLLRESYIKTILKNLGLSEEILNVYSTPEPFFYYLKDKTIPNILIIENKDTWFSIRKYLKETEGQVLGLSVGLLIYGEGKKIESSIEFLKEEELSFFKEASIYYWGDLDYEGIDIYNRLCNKITVAPFMEGYEKMLSLADIKVLERMKEKQKLTTELKNFTKNFHEDSRSKLVGIFEERKYIPQEIVNYFK